MKKNPLFLIRPYLKSVIFKFCHSSNLDRCEHMPSLSLSPSVSLSLACVNAFTTE